MSTTGQTGEAGPQPQTKDTELRPHGFEGLADSYDTTFTDSRVGRALREIVWARLDRLFQPRQRVLELGCGTGEDAVRLARRDVQVVAIDPSTRMIRLARRKASMAGCRQLIEFRCLGMQEISSFAAGDVFHGALSNFGAINCVPDLQALVADLAQRLVPGAPLLWVVMGRRAPWEWLWYLAQGRWRKAWRRFSPHGTEWRGLTISYPTPDQVQSVLLPHFAITRLAPLGVVLPPSYASAWLDYTPMLSSLMVRLESWAQCSSTLAAWSDHFIIEAVRLPQGSPHMDSRAGANG